MLMKNFFSLAILIFSTMVTFLSANEIYTETASHHLIHKVIENREYCVAAFEGDKIFINPENIVSTSEGLFINLDGTEMARLPLLQFSKRGHFIEGSFMLVRELMKKEESKGPCPECHQPTGRYGHCKNELCDFYGLRVL